METSPCGSTDQEQKTAPAPHERVGKQGVADASSYRSHSRRQNTPYTTMVYPTSFPTKTSDTPSHTCTTGYSAYVAATPLHRYTGGQRVTCISSSHLLAGAEVSKTQGAVVDDTSALLPLKPLSTQTHLTLVIHHISLVHRARRINVTPPSLPSPPPSH